MHLLKILYQGCAAIHFQEQSISFTVFGQRDRIYIKNRQTGREKIDGILFPAGRVRGSVCVCARVCVCVCVCVYMQDGESMEYSMSSVFCSLENTFGAEVII